MDNAGTIGYSAVHSRVTAAAAVSLILAVRGTKEAETFLACTWIGVVFSVLNYVTSAISRNPASPVHCTKIEQNCQAKEYFTIYLLKCILASFPCSLLRLQCQQMLCLFQSV